MGIKIQSINESVADNGIKILVHGPAGSGKTVMCGTAGAKTLLISAEGGLLALKGAIDTGLIPEAVNELVDVIEITDLDGLLEAYHFCKTSDADEYDWVMLDSISEIGEVVLENEKAHSKDPRAAYGNLITEMQAILRKFRDLPQKNVLFTCKQQRIVDSDTDRTMYVPSMPGSKLHQAIPYMFDEVFALRVEKDDEGQDYRILQTNRDIRYEAKDRSGKLEMWEDPSLFALMKKIKAASIDVADKEVDSEDQQEIADEGASKLEDVSCCDHGIPLVEECLRCKDESNQDYEIIATKKMYWHHNGSDSVMETSKDDDITNLMNDDEVSEITKVKYTKLKKAEEDQAAAGEGDGEN